MGKIYGKASVKYDEPVWILGTGNVVGKMEEQGPLGHLFDEVCLDENDMFGENSWEKAESQIQKIAIENTLRKTKLEAKDIRYLFAGDLLGQDIASSFGVLDFNIPFFGLFGACSTCGEGLCLASAIVEADLAEIVMSLTSSHFASAQKEFRYPLSYGGQRPLYATWTVTGGAGFVLSANKGDLEAGITSITPGKIVDYGIKDSFNMGCAMAPAACDTIVTNLRDFNIEPNFYDRIITGDLGNVGSEALIELVKEQGYDISRQHLDCGILIYDQNVQDVHSGGSGCGCSAVVLSAYILPKIVSGEWKRVLFVPTGALLNKTSFNEGQSIPGIAHGVVIEKI